MEPKDEPLSKQPESKDVPSAKTRGITLLIAIGVLLVPVFSVGVYVTIIWFIGRLLNAW